MSWIPLCGFWFCGQTGEFVRYATAGTVDILQLIALGLVLARMIHERGLREKRES